MNFGNKVFVYRSGVLTDESHLADTLQPETGMVVADQNDGSVNVLGLTHYGTSFFLAAVPIQTNYDDKNPGDFVTLSAVPTKAKLAADKAKAEAEAKAAAAAKAKAAAASQPAA